MSIEIRNNGNVDANVTMNSTKQSDDGAASTPFLDTTLNNGELGYQVFNTSYQSGGTYNGGCMGTWQAS